MKHVQLSPDYLVCYSEVWSWNITRQSSAEYCPLHVLAQSRHTSSNNLAGACLATTSSVLHACMNSCRMPCVLICNCHAPSSNIGDPAPLPYQLKPFYTVLDIPLDQGLQLGRLEEVGVGGLALHPLVPCHHIIPEKHAQYVSNTAMMCYARLHIVKRRYSAGL